MGGKLGVLLGRFQPFHKGHERAVGWMLSRHWKIVVAIGSSDKKRQQDNPFSAKERAWMIREVEKKHLKWRGRIKLALVPDREKHADWMKGMLRKFPPEKFVIYSNNPIVRMIFEKEGFEAKPHTLFSRGKFEGRKIRGLAARGEGVAKLVPKATAKWMDKIGAGIIAAAQKNKPAFRTKFANKLRLQRAALEVVAVRQHAPWNSQPRSGWRKPGSDRAHYRNSKLIKK